MADKLEHVLIFASSIKSVKEIKRTLNKSGFKASDIHSGLDQNSREETLRNFKNKKTIFILFIVKYVLNLNQLFECSYSYN